MTKFNVIITVMFSSPIIKKKNMNWQLDNLILALVSSVHYGKSNFIQTCEIKNNENMS